MTKLAKYEAVRHAIAECHSVDEVTEIENDLAKLEAYNRIIGDTESEAKLAEIRIRAKIKRGELLIKEKEAGLLDKGGRPEKTGNTDVPVFTNPAVLSTHPAITKRESAEDQRLARMSKAAQEDFIRKKMAAIKNKVTRPRKKKDGWLTAIALSRCMNSDAKRIVAILTDLPEVMLDETNYNILVRTCGETAASVSKIRAMLKPKRRLEAIEGGKR